MPASAPVDHPVLAALGLAVIATDPQGRITSASSQLTHLLGTRPADLAGHHVLELFHPDDNVLASEVIRARGAANGAVGLRMRHSEMGWVTVEVSSVATPLEADGFLVALRPGGHDLLLDEPVRQLAEGAPLPDVLDAVANHLAQGGSRCQVSILWDRRDGAFSSAVHSGVPDSLVRAVDAALDSGAAPASWHTYRAGDDHDTFDQDDLPGELGSTAAEAELPVSHLVPFEATPGLPSGLFVLWVAPGAKPAAAALAAIERLRWVATLAAERDHQQQQLQYATGHDPVTGLTNRARYYSVLERQRRRGEVVVIEVDLPDFARFTEYFGSAIGDEVLVEVARRLVESVRPTDLAARLGTAEFAVVCTGDPEPEVVDAVVERVGTVLDQPVRTTAGDVRVPAVVAALPAAAPPKAGPPTFYDR